MNRELRPQLKALDGLNLLSTPPREVATPPAPTFKEQCEDVIAYCHHAHQLSVDSARRCGVSSNLIEKMSLISNPSLLADVSNDAREELLAATRSAIKAAAPGHTGFFPDFLGHARRITAGYDRFITQGLDPIGDKAPSEAGCSPTSVARSLAEILALTIEHAHNIEQKQTALVLISALIAFTEQSLPEVSAEALDIRARALQVACDSTIPFLARS